MLIEKIKNFINKNQELNRKKTIENLVVFVNYINNSIIIYKCYME